MPSKRRIWALAIVYSLFLFAGFSQVSPYGELRAAATHTPTASPSAIHAEHALETSAHHAGTGR